MEYSNSSSVNINVKGMKDLFNKLQKKKLKIKIWKIKLLKLIQIIMKIK